MPAGGITNYFALAQLARDLGYDARVVSEEGLDTWWMEPDISQEWSDISQVKFGKYDYVITPEWWYRYREMVGPATIIAYAQNHMYTIKYRANHLWALSRYIASYRGIGGTLIERALFPFWENRKERFRQGALTVLSKNAHEYVGRVQEGLEALGVDLTVVNAPVDAATLLDLYNSHMFYIGLSFPEGLGMMEQEAMACGCCVVAFDGGGRSDYLVSGRTGVSVADGDCAGIVEAVQVLREDKDLRRQITRQGNEYIQRYRPALAREQLAAALAALP
jgi:hypothetical protein